ncbi:30S ribosomal protein S19 [Candidatus Woesearchaeota archaeon]|nr:30S ribosomal protein S19 [Candidatus Woesearchaeota archaeon]
MAKAITWRGKTEEEVKQMDFQEFLKLIPSGARRSLLRGANQQNPMQKRVLEKVAQDDKNLRTHARNMIIVPAMLGKSLKVYNGREWLPVVITLEMLGHYLGEFAHSRKLVTHGSAGLGATRSSKAVSAK